MEPATDIPIVEVETSSQVALDSPPRSLTERLVTELACSPDSDAGLAQLRKLLLIGLGVALVRFRSSVYVATAVGLNSSLAYFVKDSLAIEGAVTSAFAPPVFLSNENVKYVGYGGGPKYVFGHDALQPWVHLLVGGIHIVPQTALGSQNGFEMVAGGGADYAFTSSLAVRLEADYVRSYVFKQSQNFGQATLGLVYRF